MMPTNASPWMDRVADERRFPRLDGDVKTDIVVVGAGIVGVLAAWHLRKRGLKVVLLEKNHVATGDTGATTGFLTKVPDTSLRSLASSYGDGFVAKTFTVAAAAQKELIKLIKEQGIECGFAPCDAFYCAYGENDATLDAERTHFEKAWPAISRVRGSDVPGAPFAEAVRIPDEGRYDVRAFLFGLLTRMKSPDFSVHEESEVTDIVFDADVVVKTERGTVTAKKVVLATGYPIEPYAELRALLHPFVTYVIAVRHGSLPVPDHVYWDTLEPYFYYRKIADDVIIIGGCDAPFGEASKSADAHDRLEQFLKQKFPGEYTVTNRWSGSIFHTPDGLPYVFADQRERGKAIVAMGFGGNGMVFGALAAKTVADLAVGEPTDRTALLSPGRAKIVLPPRPLRVATPTTMKFLPFAPLAAFEGRATLCRAIGGRSLIVTKDADAWSAVDNRCTHQGGNLCEGTFEGRTVQCPLHGAKFDIKTGAVLEAPASRPLQTYAVRVVAGTVEVEVPTTAPAVTHLELTPVEMKEKSLRALFTFAVGASAFGAAQFGLQYLLLSKGDLQGSIIRAASFSGATLIGCALFSSAVFKWVPRLAVHWRTRRRLGVAGVLFITAHVLCVKYFYFAGNLWSAFVPLNPIKNPLVFGAFAYSLFFVMAVTSTDWAFEKLTPKRWKALHRVAYFAYWAAVSHFVTVNPVALKTPPGYLLIAVTAAALFGQLFWYLRIAGKKRFLTIGGVIGAVVIALYAVTAYLVWRDGR